MIKPVPIRLQKRVAEMGGLAPNGVPQFRVMRGCDRFTWIGGRWKHFDANGNETGSHVGVECLLKHPEAQDRYIFEMWLAPEMTETEWKSQFTEWIDGQAIETLGPYPANGEYELVRVIETPTTKAFVPLTEAICDSLVQVAKLNKELPTKHRVLAAQERREREENVAKQKRIDMIEEMGRAGWARNPHVTGIELPTDKETRLYG
jgi:hypothetical protein